MGADIEIDCPHCRQSFFQNVREITVQGTRPCPECHEDIQFAGPYIFRILRRLAPPQPIESRRPLNVLEH